MTVALEHPGSTSAERAEFAASIRAYLVREGGGTADPDGVRAAWSDLNKHFGAASISVPEKFGGLGLGLGDVAVVMEELGAVLGSSPVLGSLGLAIPLLLAAPDEPARRALLPGIADGTSIATVGWLDPESGSALTAASTEDPRVFRLFGAKTLVPDLLVADTVFVTATSPGGLGVFCVESGARGLQRRSLNTLDETRSFGHLALNETPARLIGEIDGGPELLQSTLTQAAVLLAAEQLGAAQRSFDHCLAYLKLRVQYGRPLAANQAIKHRCADMFLAIESLRSAVQYANSAAESESHSEQAVTAAVLGSHAGEVFVTVANECLQLFGAIGFTWEHHAHRYLKRAMVDRQILADPRDYREHLINTVLTRFPNRS